MPMLIVVGQSGSPELIAYRDEILLQQTVERYATAWHHVKPWYYFLVEVIPGLWLPFSALLFWLVPRWRNDWAERRAAVYLPLCWALAVLLFFSLSPGKRGVYLLPALPAFALAAAPHLAGLYARAGVGRLSLAMAAILVLAGDVFAALAFAGHSKVLAMLTEGGISSPLPVAAFAVCGTLAWLLCAWRRPLMAWPAVLGKPHRLLGIADRAGDERGALDVRLHGPRAAARSAGSATGAGGLQGAVPAVSRSGNLEFRSSALARGAAGSL